MPYLIDGHNLIGQLPDISLSDADDEIQLVLKLRSFAGRTGKKVIVVFDRGLPAGLERGLSTTSVEVRFASEKSSADEVIHKLILAVANPAGWQVVSSDTHIRHLAEQYKMQVISSGEFAGQLNGNPSTLTQSRRPLTTPATRKTHPQLSKAEIDEWLALFNADADDDGN